MLKNVLPLLLLFSFITTAQTTPIPDANFEQDLIDQGIDTNGANGNILIADAQAVTNLTIARNDIADFTGLEAFVNLITLDLGRNNFLTAPMTTLTLLEEFIFDDNNILDNLDLTQNTNLRILDIGTTGSTGNASTITALDLSQNINLESAYIYAFLNLADISLPQTAILKNVQIIATAEDIFDFTNHSGLEELWLNQNTQTTNITLPAVKTTLKKLDIRNQRVSSVDLTGFVVLEDVNLGGTGVSTLLLPTSTALKRLTIRGHELPNGFSFASVPELEILHVTSNSLTTTFDVDITSNTLIYDLNLSSNKMVNLDMTQNTLLTNVNVSSNQLVTFDSSQNVLLENLNASRNVITTLDLSQNIALETLNLNTNELPTLDLATNIELRTLNLGTNELPNLDITTNTKIRTLHIDNNLFTGTGLDLTQNVELSYLNAEVNQIESLDITQNLDLSTIILNHNLFPGTAILDQFYSIRAGDDGIFGGRLEVSHNLLTGQIPNFADLFHLGPADTDRWTRYFELTIDNNYFHFADLEEDHLDFTSYVDFPGAYNIPVIRKYHYAPQAKVNAIENLTPNAGESITLLTEVRGAQNHYQWFKDGVPIPDAADSPEYTITNLNTCDNGVYHSEITSDLVPFENSSPPGTNGKNLLLVRNDITLTVNATKGCVSLVSPSANDTNVPINTGIEWQDNPGACGYKITVTNVNTGTPIQYSGSPISGLDVGEITLFNFDADLPANTEISVQITPYFDDGDFGGCITESFTTNSTTEPTECTSLNSPENNDIDVPADISSISWNPANAADSYKLEITSTSGANNLSETNVGNTLSYAFGNAFQPGDVVTVSIIPTNALGDATPCSSESFTILNTGMDPTPPSCTSLIAPGPADGDTDVAVDLNQITWNAASDATQYRITIDGSTSDMNDVTDLLVTGTAHSFTNNFDNGETVSVTIVPLNGTVEPTTTCTTETFTIIPAGPTPPSCTSLIAPGPADGDTDVAVDLNQITWNAASDATQYRITVNGSTRDLNDVTDLIISGTSHTFTNNFDNGETVTVIIVPLNGTVEPTTTCTTETFTIIPAGPTPPSCTSLIAPGPADGDTDVAVDLNQITWNAASDATQYRITIDGSTSDMNDVTDLLVTGTTHPFTNNFNNGETVSVTIVPLNGAVEPTTTCTTETFTIEASPAPIPPDCTSPTVPEPNALDVVIDTQIEWSGVTNADGYFLSIGTEEGNYDIIDNEDVGILTSYSLSDDLPFNTTIYVVITPYSATNGEAVNCIPISFTTVAEPIVEIDDETEYGFSPDGDGINEYWHIDNIEYYPENMVSIYNRWGDLVFQIENYNNTENAFRGEANRMTQLGANTLPSGTYFFIVHVPDDSVLKKTQGYLVLKR